MRLTIAGGGGFRVPLVYRALSAGPFAGLVRELVLYDVDPARLAAIEAVLASLAQQGPPGSGPQVRAVSSLPEALDGADMVFAAIRPGGPPTSGSPWTSDCWARKPRAPAASLTRCGPFRRCCGSRRKCGAAAP